MLRRALLAAPLASLALACSSSSSGPCVAEGTITVTVSDEDVDNDTNFLCDATVTIAPTSGGASQTLMFQGYDGSDANCVYVINEPPGSYVLSASAPAHMPMTQTLDVETVECVTASPMTRIGLFESESDIDAGLGETDASTGG